VTGEVYEWDTQSTYIQEPPYFEKFSMDAGSFCDIRGARPLAIFGDSVTTDHISPRARSSPLSPGRPLPLNTASSPSRTSTPTARGAATIR
jgi:aconitase A